MKTYNCARVHIGTYFVDPMGMRGVDCGYIVVEGHVRTRKLRPIKVRGTDHERTISHLQTVVLYPVTDEAIVEIINSKGTSRVKLVKYRKGGGSRSTIVKVGL